MTRNLKPLGMSLVAMFAVSALVTSSASAVDVVTTGKSPAMLTGVGHNHVFSAHSTPKFECTTAKFAATVTNGASEITADALYEGTLNATPHTDHHCNSSSGTATIDMNGCGYILTGETTGTAPAGHTAGKDATVWLECPGSNKIQITSSLGITLSIPAQTPTTGGVSYTNVASHNGNSAVAVKATVTGVTTTCAGTFLCTLGGYPHHSNQWQYTGDVTMTAYENTEGLPTPVVEGARTSLVSS